VIERLMRYIATRSLSRMEHALVDVVAADLTRAGLLVRRQGNNLWCELGDAPHPRLLLNSHLDTVPPQHGWSADPWKPRRLDGRVIGLGANDAKGCVVAMIAAVLRLQSRLARGIRLGGAVVLALTAEEEISGQGLGTIVDQLRPLDAAIVGEPTGLIPMIAQRGLLVLRGTARGRTAHPANTPTNSPDNAIHTAARDLAALPDFDWGPPHPLLGRCHAHVTQICGGSTLNVVPDACEFHMDVRTTPGESHAALHQRLARAMRSELTIHSARLEPVETDPDALIVSAVRRALRGAQPAGSPTMSDMVFLKGVPSVKIGPGQSARSHTPDEFILEHELAAGIAAYDAIVQQYYDPHGSVAPVDCHLEAAS
jgi:acetylornithine deacetylase